MLPLDFLVQILGLEKIHLILLSHPCNFQGYLKKNPDVNFKIVDANKAKTHLYYKKTKQR